MKNQQNGKVPEKNNKQEIAKSNVLETETIGEGKRHYFIDLCQAANNKHYLRIVRSDRVADEGGKPAYKREVVRVFEESLGPMLNAISEVFGRYNAGQ